MRKIKTAQDVYAEVDTFVAALDSLNLSRLGSKLSVRIHDIAWTSGSELLRELQSMMNEMLGTDGDNLPVLMKEELSSILRSIEHILTDVRQSYG